MGRRRLPPDEMRWFATSGIIVTSDPVRDRIIAFTRSMSGATRETSCAMLPGCLSSKGTTTPTKSALGLPAARRRLNDGARSHAANPRRNRNGCRKEEHPLVEIVRTNDIVLIGFLQSLLENANIPVLVADAHISALEGMIGAFPRRVLVPEDHAAQARRLIRDAGLSEELRNA